MEHYSTKQRQILLAFLGKHPDQQLSARSIAEQLRDSGVSQSAVYRNLAALEADGKVRRGTGTGREACYQYIGADECRGCLHLSCTRCGRTFHMERPRTQLLIERVARDEGFSIDRSETVLYGLCKACQE